MRKTALLAIMVGLLSGCVVTTGGAPPRHDGSHYHVKANKKKRSNKARNTAPAPATATPAPAGGQPTNVAPPVATPADQTEEQKKNPLIKPRRNVNVTGPVKEEEEKKNQRRQPAPGRF